MSASEEKSKEEMMFWSIAASIMGAFFIALYTQNYQAKIQLIKDNAAATSLAMATVAARIKSLPENTGDGYAFVDNRFVEAQSVLPERFAASEPTLEKTPLIDTVTQAEINVLGSSRPQPFGKHPSQDAKYLKMSYKMEGLLGKNKHFCETFVDNATRLWDAVYIDDVEVKNTLDPRPDNDAMLSSDIYALCMKEPVRTFTLVVR